MGAGGGAREGGRGGIIAVIDALALGVCTVTTTTTAATVVVTVTIVVIVVIIGAVIVRGNEGSSEACSLVGMEQSTHHALKQK